MQTLATGHLAHEGSSPHKLSGGRTQESSGFSEAKGGHGAPRHSASHGATPSGLRRGLHCREGPSDSGFQPHPGPPLSVPSGPLAPRARRHPNPLGMSVLRMWHTRPGRAILLLLHPPQPWIRGLYRGQKFTQSR
ncbi:hypothetical protein FLJ30313, isoform CRA_d [Homo sapiens]|nr:RecName: Full=Putative MIR1-1HG-AS1; AltName: Full=C20orf166 antisense gene protein 1 [Homo sapiens]EAW75359.1 hypothetical protein FLJ30313, isoform CRA_d [Homo sapiens]BAB70817.1 unnamed protein product [Homo sapiens]